MDAYDAAERGVSGDQWQDAGWGRRREGRRQGEGGRRQRPMTVDEEAAEEEERGRLVGSEAKAADEVRAGGDQERGATGS